MKVKGSEVIKKPLGGRREEGTGRRERERGWQRGVGAGEGMGTSVESGLECGMG